MPDDGEEAEDKSASRAAFLQTRSTSDTDDEEDDLGGQSGDEILEEEEYPELVSTLTAHARVLRMLIS